MGTCILVIMIVIAYILIAIVHAVIVFSEIPELRWPEICLVGGLLWPVVLLIRFIGWIGERRVK